MLQPATRLMNRLNLKKKRSLVGAAVLLALAVPLTHLVAKQVKEICLVGQEKQGLHLARALGQTLEQLAILRADAGDGTDAERLKATQQSFDNAVKALDQAVQSNDDLALREPWNTLKPQLVVLKNAKPMQADGATAYRAALHKIGELFALGAERSKLRFDSQADTHYLALNAVDHIPALIRHSIAISSPAPAQQAQAKEAAAATEENAFGDAFGDAVPAADAAPAEAAPTPDASPSASAPVASAADASAAAAETAAVAEAETPPSAAPMAAPSQAAALTRLEDAGSATLLGLDKAAAADPRLKEALQTTRRGFGLALNQYIESARQLLEKPEHAIKTDEQALHESVFKLNAVNLEQLAQKLEARQSSLISALVWQLAFCGLMLGSLWIILSTLYRSTAESLRKLSDGVSKMAGGDLNASIALASHDEFQALAQHINHMASELREFMHIAQESSSRLHQEVNTLHHASQDLAQASIEQTEAAHTMASSIEQLSVSIGQVSDHAQQGAQLSSETGAVSAESSEVIHKMANEMTTISESVRTTATAIESLGEHSDKISSVVQVIKEVAGQTNLLALNAAIEAARAGEQGRGFAVVADEVRKLAERTTRSTQEIAEIIEAIQDATMNAILAMGSVVAKVNEGVELANNAGTAITKIRDQGEQTQLAVNDISTALQEQTSTSQLLAETVQKIAAMSANSNQAAQNAAQTAQQMHDLASRIQEAVHRFKAD